MVDKILLSEICIIANNNIENEIEDYKFDVKGNGSLRWGKRSATLSLMNIARHWVSHLDHLMSLQQKYYVEMSNSLVVYQKKKTRKPKN